MQGNVEMNMLRRLAVGDILRRNALRFPDKRALIFSSPAGEIIEYTWKEFNSAINRVANGLLALGIGKGDKVGVFSMNSFQFAVLMFAPCKIGAIVAPANAGLRHEELAFVIKHSDDKVLFVQDILVDRIKEIAPAIADVKLGYIGAVGGKGMPEGWVDFDELLDNSPDDEPKVDIDIDDVATLTYTSGTEALPKGAMMTHGNLCNLMTTLMQWGILPEDVELHALPLFYTGGVGILTAALLMGQTVVLAHSPDPASMAKLIQEYQVSLIVLPPTLWVRLLQVSGIEQKVSSMRVGLTFGATISEGMIRGWNRIAPQMSWISYYGQSETSCSGTVGHFKTVNEIPEGDLGWVGKPVHDLEVKIVDEEDRDVPAGQTGEIVFRGPAVFKGYYKDPKKTDEVFAGGWLHSGDLGRINESSDLFFVDRKKDMVKSGGENIATASVEYVVSSHPKVAEVAAFGVPHPDWMEALTVVVTTINNEAVAEEEIIQFCKQKLPGFKVPKYVRVVDEFPRNPTGKILKRELRKKYKDLASQEE
jgi:fatty-acyl-CoA synthase